MASFHQSFQVIKRSAGRSSVACAAYRSGGRLTDSRSGNVFDFSRRKGVAHAEILAPDGAPEWAQDREVLWNAVEAFEKRRDAQLAREINMALPHELTAEERLALVRDYVGQAFVAKGMVADFAIHEPVAENGDDPRNFHAHVMLTMRKIGRGGFNRTKTREWNADAQLVAWRAAWAETQNRALERAGHRVRVDHRSLEAQRQAAQERGDRAEAAKLDRAPEIHIGPRARAAVRRQHELESRPRETGLRQQPRREAREKGEPLRGVIRVEGQDGPSHAKRLIRYPQIDQGSRATWNAQLVARNQARSFARAEHRERQAARLRMTELRALRQAREAETQLRVLPPPSKGLFRSKGLSTAEFEARRREWIMARDRARRRAQLARALLGEVEGILAGLLHIRGLHQQRHRSLQLLWLPPGGLLGHHRGHGRGRGQSGSGGVFEGV